MTFPYARLTHTAAFRVRRGSVGKRKRRKAGSWKLDHDGIVEYLLKQGAVIGWILCTPKHAPFPYLSVAPPFPASRKLRGNQPTNAFGHVAIVFDPSLAGRAALPYDHSH